MAKKIASKKVNNPASSLPQIIKELKALGVTNFKSPELEFSIHPAALAEVIAPSSISPIQTTGQEDEVDFDEKQFQVVYKGAANVTQE